MEQRAVYKSLSLKVDKRHHSKLKKMADKSGISMKRFLHYAIDYFEANQLEWEKDLSKNDMSNATVYRKLNRKINERTNAIIGYIKKQDEILAQTVIKRATAEHLPKVGNVMSELRELQAKEGRLTFSSIESILKNHLESNK